MKTKIAIVAGFLVAVVIVILITRSGKSPDIGPEPSASASGAPPPAADAVEIVMSYSTEKKEWIDAAAADFKKLHPEIKLTLTGKGSIDLVQAVIDGKDKPTLISPADSLVLNLLDSDWQTKNRTPILATGDDAPQPLVITPLVFVVWEDRANVLLKASGGTISWKAIHKAVNSNEGWPAIKGDKSWGCRRPARFQVPDICERNRERSLQVRDVDGDLHDGHGPVRSVQV